MKSEKESIFTLVFESHVVVPSRRFLEILLLGCFARHGATNWKHLNKKRLLNHGNVLIDEAEFEFWRHFENGAR